MIVLVTGAAGFIGSNLVDRLLADGHVVVGYDNFSTGRRRFLERALACDRFTLVEGDTLHAGALGRAMSGCEIVFHLAANADVRFGTEHPRKDLEQNTVATFNVLEAMRANSVRRIAFSSTGSIYGEPQVHPTPEDAPFPVQTSLYGASKLACEGLIQAYSAGFGFEGYIFRFVSILGERYSHGHVFDFYRSLSENPNELRVLGDGHQRKSYLYVQDCLDAMILATGLGDAKASPHSGRRGPDPAGLTFGRSPALSERSESKGTSDLGPRTSDLGQTSIYNLGTDQYCEVNDSIRWITGRLGIDPRLCYTGGERGWIGDSPFIFLDCRKIRALGWAPRLTIRDGVLRTLDYLRANPWLLEVRS